MLIDPSISVESLKGPLNRFLELSAPKTLRLASEWDDAAGAPVFTVEGRYESRGWTEWTQGFRVGCSLLQYDATGERSHYRAGRHLAFSVMPSHVTDMGVHDHGFNQISTFGNLRRLILEGRAPNNGDLAHCELALRASGAVQAARWQTIADGTGYIYSFNGRHSLFSDTIRSCRSLVLAHCLGQPLLGEDGERASLLRRAAEHIQNTARFNVYFGEGRDLYDVEGRVCHESLFNPANGSYRCPGTQQGYSPFSTWTRGLAWILLGAAEQLEFFRALPDAETDAVGGRETIEAALLRMACATAEFYIGNAAMDGVPCWDTGAPGLAAMPGFLDRPSQPDNDHEPVDSSAAVIAAQGFLRLGHCLGGATESGTRYIRAGLGIARTVFNAPYLSEDPGHQGLILHSVYHRPNGWDYIPPGKSVPQGESSIWGDYHALELAVYLMRLIERGPYLTFFGPSPYSANEERTAT